MKHITANKIPKSKRGQEIKSIDTISSPLDSFINMLIWVFAAAVAIPASLLFIYFIDKVVSWTQF